MTRARDLTGLVFGRLTVLHLETRTPRRKWKCVCSCGAVVYPAQKEITRGDTRSCGCLRKEQTSARNKVGKVDRQRLSPDDRQAYTKWAAMWVRVRHPYGKSACYAGVTIAPRWKSFAAFLEDMGPPPVGYSLERKDNSLGYGPTNCEWVPLVHQAKNTSRSVRVEHNGAVKIISDHARDAGLAPDIVFDRINKLKWTITKALTTPVRKQTRRNNATL